MRAARSSYSVEGHCHTNETREQMRCTGVRSRFGGDGGGSGNSAMRTGGGRGLTQVVRLLKFPGCTHTRTRLRVRRALWRRKILRTRTTATAAANFLGGRSSRGGVCTKLLRGCENLCVACTGLPRVQRNETVVTALLKADEAHACTSHSRDDYAIYASTLQRRRRSFVRVHYIPTGVNSVTNAIITRSTEFRVVFLSYCYYCAQLEVSWLCSFVLSMKIKYSRVWR